MELPQNSIQNTQERSELPLILNRTFNISFDRKLCKAYLLNTGKMTKKEWRKFAKVQCRERKDKIERCEGETEKFGCEIIKRTQRNS